MYLVRIFSKGDYLLEKPVVFRGKIRGFLGICGGWDGWGKVEKMGF